MFVSCTNTKLVAKCVIIPLFIYFYSSISCLVVVTSIVFIFFKKSFCRLFKFLGDSRCFILCQIHVRKEISVIIISGRFEEHIVKERQESAANFLKYVARNPVLCRSLYVKKFFEVCLN